MKLTAFVTVRFGVSLKCLIFRCVVHLFRVGCLPETHKELLEPFSVCCAFMLSELRAVYDGLNPNFADELRRK